MDLRKFVLMCETEFFMRDTRLLLSSCETYTVQRATKKFNSQKLSPLYWIFGAQIRKKYLPPLFFWSEGFVVATCELSKELRYMANWFRKLFRLEKVASSAERFTEDLCALFRRQTAESDLFAFRPVFYSAPISIIHYTMLWPRKHPCIVKKKTCRTKLISQEYGVNFASCLIWMEVDAIILVVTFSSALNLDVAS